jgi:hypothetical protein
MAKKPRYPIPQSQKPQPRTQPASSVILALETAVLLLEQSGYTEEMIYGLVNCVLKGFITGGEWTPEYLAAVNRIESEQREEQARLQALRDSMPELPVTSATVTSR